MAKDSDRTPHTDPRPLTRRSVIGGALASPLLALGAPWIIRPANAQSMSLGPYQEAKINWRQAEGEQITVGVIPAGYFDNLVGLTPEFEALTGIKVRYEKIPPGQVRQKAMLDLSSQDRHLRHPRGRLACIIRSTPPTNGSSRSIPI